MYATTKSLFLIVSEKRKADNVLYLGCRQDPSTFCNIGRYFLDTHQRTEDAAYFKSSTLETYFTCTMSRKAKFQAFVELRGRIETYDMRSLLMPNKRLLLLPFPLFFEPDFLDRRPTGKNAPRADLPFESPVPNSPGCVEEETPLDPR